MKSKHIVSDNTDFVTVYHGTNKPYDIVRANCWVTMARDEAIGYARTYIVDDLQSAREFWILKMEVRRDQIEWKDGCGDKDYDGQHGKILADTTVIEKESISLCD